MAKAQYVDKELLDEKITKSGFKIGYLCDIIGISRTAFDRKRCGITPFKASEVYVLCDMLKIADMDKSKIFNPKVE